MTFMRKQYKRITITLNKKILREVDKRVDGIDILSRSKAIEQLLKDSLEIGKVSLAFINAGGEGTRMRPFTFEIPKPLIPVKGKPLLEHTLDLLRRFEIKDVIIGLGYKAKMIRDHFGNGAKFGLNISYVVEKKKLGTAGTLSLAKRYLKEGPFFLFWADVLANLDLADFMRVHHESGGAATICYFRAESVKYDPSK